TDAVVEAHPVRCSHFDAFRFFTPEARPVNRLQPTRENQPELEQPGCLHANMDLLRAALTLGPACPGDLLLDTFELARDIRVLDMRASPYDVSSSATRPFRSRRRRDARSTWPPSAASPSGRSPCGSGSS